MVDILGLSGVVRVSPVDVDTQTQGVGHGGHPRIVRDDPGIPWILRHRGWVMVDILGLSGAVWISLVNVDTQMQGVVRGGHPQIVLDGPGIPGVHGYSDTGGWLWWDCLGRSGVPRCTRILRHRGLVMVDILGLSGMVWVFPSNVDTQTQEVGHGGHPQIVRGGRGIPGVRGYSDAGGCSWWTSSDCPGQSGYPQCTRILRHRELVMVDIFELSWTVRVSPVYADTQTQGIGHGRHP